MCVDNEDDKTPLLPTNKPQPPPSPFPPVYIPINLYERRIQPCLVEFFGTAMFVYAGTMTQQNELLLANAIGHGLTIAMLILAMGKVR